MKFKLVFLFFVLLSSAFAKEYEIYVPDSAKDKPNPPMVVAMHGCTQNANDFMDLTGLKDEADKRGFIVLAPQKNLKIAPPENPLKCWAWYWPSSNKRDPKRGELKRIMDLVAKVKEEYQVDPDNVYVAGFSAGAVMSSIMANCYPDVFKGAAIHSGLPFKGLRHSFGSNIDIDEEIQRTGQKGCAPQLDGGSGAEVWTSQLEDVVKSLPSNEQRRIAKLVSRSNKCSQEVSNKDKRLAHVAIFQGTKDKIVWDRQSNNAFMQFAANPENGQSALMSAGEVKEEGKKTTRFVQYSSERLSVSMREVQGMGHAWSGGKEGYFFSDPEAPNATKIMLDEFGL